MPAAHEPTYFTTGHDEVKVRCSLVGLPNGILAPR
jgi:hypothetical protein